MGTEKWSMETRSCRIKETMGPSTCRPWYIPASGTIETRTSSSGSRTWLNVYKGQRPYDATPTTSACTIKRIPFSTPSSPKNESASEENGTTTENSKTSSEK